jgi:CheY-like chemotaxis protein
MSETPNTVQRRDALEFATAFAKSLGEDLSALVGSQTRLDTPEISIVDGATLAASSAPVTHARCRRRDGGDEVPHLLLPLDAAVTFAGLLMGHAKDRIEELKHEEIAPETLDALSEVMNLTAAVLSRAIGEEAGLNSGLQQGDTQPRPTPAADGEWLPPGSYRNISYALKLPDRAPARFDVLLPASLAAQWLAWPDEAEETPASDSADATAAADVKPAAGRESASVPSGEAPPQAAAGTSAATGPDETAHAGAPVAPEDAPPGAIVFIDAAPPEAERGQEIESALGRTCHWMDPATLNADAMEDLAQAAAIVISFDLGNRCGLDLLESLQRDERTRGVRMAVGSAAPTRGSVAAALRAGARSFLCQPYDTDEITRRLFASSP